MTNYYHQISYPYYGNCSGYIDYRGNNLNFCNNMQSNFKAKQEPVRVVGDNDSDGIKSVISIAAMLASGIAIYKCRGKIANFFKKLLPKAGKKAGQQTAAQAGQQTTAAGEKAVQKVIPPKSVPTGTSPLTPDMPVTPPEGIKPKMPASSSAVPSSAADVERVSSTVKPKSISATTEKNVEEAVIPKKVTPSSSKPNAPSATPSPATSALSRQTLDAQIAEFEKMSDSSLSKGAKDYLKQLKPHNFGEDKSHILVSSKYNGGYSYESVNLSKQPFEFSLKRPNTAFGEKISIECLPDGRKAIYVITPSGVRDSANRTLTQNIRIVSDGKEFTPVQKALIEIMSSRGPVETSVSDILAVANYNNGGKLGINRDILLSAIYTAREQATSKIKPDLVKRALAVANPGDIFQF